MGGSGCVLGADEGAAGLTAGDTGVGGADGRAAICGAGDDGHSSHAITAADSSSTTAAIAAGARRLSAR